MIIFKLQSPLSKIFYSRAFRFPSWLLGKLQYRKIDSSKEYPVKMRLGHTMLIRPTQNYLKNVLISRQYHDQDILFFERFISKDSTVLDIGANIGLYSCAMAKFFAKKNIKIVAIEALEKNFELLKKNLEMNKFANVQALRMALGESEGELRFHLPTSDFVGNAAGENILNSLELKSCETEKFFTEVVPMKTLDALCLEHSVGNCDFIKIDVEGAELFVFKGGRNFIVKNRPIIQCEFNAYWLKNNNIEISDFVNFFGPLDYTIFTEKGDIYEPFDLSHFNYSLVDLLFVPTEKITLLTY